MFSKKAQVIKFEQNTCHANVSDNSVLFVRVSDEVRDKNAMFEVPITHNAYVIKSGGDGRFYKSGIYPVFSEKAEAKAWAKGYSVDIIFMPKDTSVVIKWGTPDKVRYRDEASNKVINVGACGQFGITITNCEQFFRKVVGVRRVFDLKDFQDRFRAAVVNEFADCFLSVVKDLKLTYDQFDIERKKIGDRVGEILTAEFAQSWGIGIEQFIIQTFEISQEDMDAVEEAAAEAKRQEKLKEYLAKLEELDDKGWEREKYLRNLELEDRAAYYEVLKVVGHPPVGGAAKTPAGLGGAAFCPKCGAAVASGAAFCSKCGTKIGGGGKVCPECGKTVEADAVFCAFCGHRLK